MGVVGRSTLLLLRLYFVSFLQATNEAGLHVEKR